MENPASLVRSVLALTVYVNLTEFPKRDFLVNLGLNMLAAPPPLSILLLCNPARVILGERNPADPLEILGERKPDDPLEILGERNPDDPLEILGERNPDDPLEILGERNPDDPRDILGERKPEDPPRVILGGKSSSASIGSRCSSETRWALRAAKQAGLKLGQMDEMRAGKSCSSLHAPPPSTLLMLTSSDAAEAEPGNVVKINAEKTRQRVPQCDDDDHEVAHVAIAAIAP